MLHPAANTLTLCTALLLNVDAAIASNLSNSSAPPDVSDYDGPRITGATDIVALCFFSAMTLAMFAAIGLFLRDDCCPPEEAEPGPHDPEAQLGTAPLLAEMPSQRYQTL